jgi:hypothetical protein
MGHLTAILKSKYLDIGSNNCSTMTLHLGGGLEQSTSFQTFIVICLLIRFLVIVAILVQSYPLHACDCIMTPVSTQISTAQFVVTGRVIDLLDTDEEKSIHPTIRNRAYKVRFKIINAYKGELEKAQTIEIDTEFTNCDLIFIKNQKYLLFLYKNQLKYLVIHCSSSESIRYSAKAIHEVNRLTKKNGP